MSLSELLLFIYSEMGLIVNCHGRDSVPSGSRFATSPPSLLTCSGAPHKKDRPYKRINVAALTDTLLSDTPYKLEESLQILCQGLAKVLFVYSHQQRKEKKRKRKKNNNNNKIHQLSIV